MQIKKIQQILLYSFFVSSFVLPLVILTNSDLLYKTSLVLMNSPMPLVFYQKEIAIKVDFTAVNTDGTSTTLTLTKKYIEGIKGPSKRVSQYLSHFFINTNPELSEQIFKYALCNNGTLSDLFELRREFQTGIFNISYRHEKIKEKWEMSFSCK